MRCARASVLGRACPRARERVSTLIWHTPSAPPHPFITRTLCSLANTTATPPVWCAMLPGHRGYLACRAPLACDGGCLAWRARSHPPSVIRHPSPVSGVRPGPLAPRRYKNESAFRHLIRDILTSDVTRSSYRVMLMERFEESLALLVLDHGQSRRQRHALGRRVRATASQGSAGPCFPLLQHPPPSLTFLLASLPPPLTCSSSSSLMWLLKEMLASVLTHVRCSNGGPPANGNVHADDASRFQRNADLHPFDVAFMKMKQQSQKRYTAPYSTKSNGSVKVVKPRDPRTAKEEDASLVARVERIQQLDVELCVLHY